MSNAFNYSLRRTANLKQKLPGLFSLSVFTFFLTFSIPLLISTSTYFYLYRASNTTTSLQGQIQSLRDNTNKIVEERNVLKKEMETKNQEVQDKVRTIMQVKKIGRRYKTQYDELKVQHEKVRAMSPKFCIVQNDDGKLFYLCWSNLNPVLLTIWYRWLLRLRQAQPKLRRLVKPQFRNCRVWEILWIRLKQRPETWKDSWRT